jgi:succinate dehydrogenase flavin-adding protein (antitoxin of CptAB toxin-antitoxin module)
MNTMKETANNSSFNISYNAIKNVLVINRVCIPVNTEWNFRIYQDSFFRGIAERDLIVEQYIRSANAMLIDFHYHRRKLICFDPFWETWVDLIDDKDSEDVSCIILEEAEEQLSELFMTCFNNGWKSRRVYIEAAICLLFEINKQRGELGYGQLMSECLACCIPCQYEHIHVALTA